MGNESRQSKVFESNVYIWYMEVSWNVAIPKSSNFMGFSIRNHLFWGPPFLERCLVICSVDVTKTKQDVGLSNSTVLQQGAWTVPKDSHPNYSLHWLYEYLCSIHLWDAHHQVAGFVAWTNLTYAILKSIFTGLPWIDDERASSGPVEKLKRHNKSVPTWVTGTEQLASKTCPREPTLI